MNDFDGALKQVVYHGRMYTVAVGGGTKQALALSPSALHPGHWYFEDPGSQQQFLVSLENVSEVESDSD